MVYLLCNSPTIYSYQGNSIGVLSSGLLAKLPATLDSFLPMIQVCRGGWSGLVGSHCEVVGSHKVAGKNTSLPYGSIGALDSQFSG